MGWKILKKKTVFKNKFAAMEEWMVRVTSGKLYEFYIKRDHDVAEVFCLTKDGKALVIKEYFVNQEKMMISLVAGTIGKKEKPLEAAKRELEEETGYRAQRMISLGSSIKGKYETGTVYHFLALGAKSTGKKHFDTTEEIETKLIPLSQIKKFFSAVRIPELYAEVCVYRALEYLNKKKISNLSKPSKKSARPQ